MNMCVHVACIHLPLYINVCACCPHALAFIYEYVCACCLHALVFIHKYVRAFCLHALAFIYEYVGHVVCMCLHSITFTGYQVDSHTKSTVNCAQFPFGL